MTNVLVAEDNTISRELLHELPEARGYNVIEEATVMRHFRMIEQTLPDILVLDIGMY
jgi:CheY-like chemotaxis protein